MSACECLCEEAKNIFFHYRPIYTELSGIRDVVISTRGLAYAALWRIVDSNDFGTGTPLATVAIQISAVGLAQGLIKLTLPIIGASGYLISKNCF